MEIFAVVIYSPWPKNKRRVNTKRNLFSEEAKQGYVCFKFFFGNEKGLSAYQKDNLKNRILYEASSPIDISSWYYIIPLEGTSGFVAFPI